MRLLSEGLTKPFLVGFVQRQLNLWPEKTFSPTHVRKPRLQEVLLNPEHGFTTTAQRIRPGATQSLLLQQGEKKDAEGEDEKKDTEGEDAEGSLDDQAGSGEYCYVATLSLSEILHSCIAKTTNRGTDNTRIGSQCA